MDIVFKIIAIGLITCVATLIVRPVRADFAIIIGIVGGLIIIFLIINYLTGIFNIINLILGMSGINSTLYTVLLKIVIIQSKNTKQTFVILKNKAQIIKNN